MNWKIPLFQSYWDEDDITAVTNVIRRGTYWAAGPEIDQLEQNLAAYVQRKHAVSFNSGTSALHAALLAHGITSGEVIVPSFTFIATANTVVLAGGKPVFAEVEQETYGLDPEDVQKKITKKTKAIIPVHYGGGPCKEIKKLREIASDHHLILIEDAAESLGSKIGTTMVGTLGDSAMFSFCQNKIITAGEGGIIVTDDKNIAENLRLIRSHGRVDKGEDYFSTTKDMDYVQVGYNYRMSTMTAALAVSQLQKIESIIQMRREKAHYFNKQLESLQHVLIPVELPGCRHVYQMYSIQLSTPALKEKIQQNLEKAGIMTKVYFEPIHLKTYYKKQFNYKPGDLPRTENLSKKVLTLPFYTTLANQQIDTIVEIIKNS
jgi:perosamine synthetase